MALERAQGYPRIEQRQDGGLEVKDRVYDATNIGYDAFVQQLPTFGSSMADTVTDAFLIQRSMWAGDQTNAFWYADLTYGQVGPDVWTIENAETAEPIEQHVNFLTKWKKSLAMADTTASAPAFFDTASDENISTANKNSYRWVSNDAECPSSMSIKSTTIRTKPGIDSYITGATTARVSSRVPHVDLVKFWPSLYRVGYRYRMDALCQQYNGFSPEAEFWVCVESSVQQDGYYWLGVARFRYNFLASGWDTDIYNNVG